MAWSRRPAFSVLPHDYTLSALERHSRLRATVVVDPDVSHIRLRELDRCWGHWDSLGDRQHDDASGPSFS